MGGTGIRDLGWEDRAYGDPDLGLILDRGGYSEMGQAFLG